MSEGHFRLEQQGHIVTITLNRPEKRNAVNVDVAQGMAAAVTRSEADDKVRVVVLCSSGGEVFCAGADLKAVSEGRGQELYVDGFGFGGIDGQCPARRLRQMAQRS